jgi:hypothetical protein
MSITNIFYQSWEEELPNVIYNRNKLYIPSTFIYKRFSMKDIISYLTDKWPHVLPAFYSYSIIQHKIDLWRYCILYDTGGIYMDADCILMENIECLLKSDMFCVTNTRGKMDIFNGFIGTYPNNPIFLEIINFMLTADSSNYYFNCIELYKIVNSYIDINSITQEYKLNDKSVYLLFDTKQKDNRFYCYLYDKCLLVETNPFYPYRLREFKKYKINTFDDGNEKYKDYLNEWYVLYTENGKYMLKNIKNGLIINSISSWKVIELS